ncbi:MAG: hypothetical protein RLZZ22_1201, partial [Pseudomonadota bacterium]
MNRPTFQILMLLTVILVVIMTVVLFAVRHANRQIPGLSAWAYSYLLGLLVCFNFLARPHVPEGLSVVITQVLMFSSAWLNLAAARAYAGRPPWPLAYFGWAVITVAGLSSHLTWPQPEPTLRLALGLGAAGTLMLLSAQAMLSAELRRQPERYLFTLACGGHGLLMLATALTLLLGQADLADPERLGTV